VERMKDEFVSTVSHELRTPLTAIYGSLDLLNAGLAGELPPDARQLLGICHQSTERLIRLINDMLDLEKIASGKLVYRMQSQPLLPLLEQSVRDTRSYGDNLRVTFRLHAQAHPVVTADADRIVQVCVNLLSNAAKFSPADGEVEMWLGLEDGKARVAVVDRGAGVPPEFQDRVFDRFSQADSSDRRSKGGTGLGLAICRSIVEAHGGRLAFTSEPNVRTEFFFELPLAAA
jgi:signal transduction histidine kinase